MVKCKALLSGYRQSHYLCETDDSYKDIAEDVENRFDTSNYEIHRRLPKAKNEKVIGLMNNELGREIMK